MSIVDEHKKEEYMRGEYKIARYLSYLSHPTSRNTTKIEATHYIRNIKFLGDSNKSNTNSYLIGQLWGQTNKVKEKFENCCFTIFKVGFCYGLPSLSTHRNAC